jgi:hypothetical protein
VDKDSSGAARKRNEPPKQQSQQPKLVRDKPEKILGVTKIQGELHFLVKYKNKARTSIFSPVLRIRNPGSDAFLTPGSGMGKIRDPERTTRIVFPRT